MRKADATHMADHDQTTGIHDMKRTALLATLFSLAAATPALAHTGVGATHGFVHGFLHPIGGMDHMLAMVAVGLWASLLGGRALWIVPAAFVSAMVLGGILGVNGIGLPYIEAGILGSVLVLGALVAMNVQLPTALAAALVAVFAVAHGHAHGAEMPEESAAITYAAGFVLATAGLHLAGIALGMALTRLAGTRLARVMGIAVMASGAALASGG
jgi:urease accessory protein